MRIADQRFSRGKVVTLLVCRVLTHDATWLDDMTVLPQE
jgi:hypothetical protein